MDNGSEQDAVRQAGAGRLGALLQDLTHTHGRVQAAELLGVNYRTLARSLESGELTATMQQALERYEGELPGDGDVPDVVTTDDTQDGNRDDDDELELLRQEVAALRGEVAQAVGRFDEQLDRLERGAAGQSQAASAPPQPDPSRARFHPQVVTAEPGEDEERVYRGALPLLAEWRAMRERMAGAAYTLDYLKAEERLLELEIELAGEHRLTLPPDSYPWDGIRRHAELRLRHRVLLRVRRERRWTWLLNWSARLLTLGLWGR
ncbi:MAG: hypothetical protein OXD50_01620 [Chloroflexi bacterium]|nr:hypothetical protein [Chloroflexota bacterium]